MRSKSPNDLNLHLRDDISAMIKRMVASNPDNRYPDVATLIIDVRAARYPVETKCTFCGHIHHTAVAPPQTRVATAADALCQQRLQRRNRVLLQYLRLLQAYEQQRSIESGYIGAS
jgi:hypothetical protein